jgi:hypothetical protein
LSLVHGSHCGRYAARRYTTPQIGSAARGIESRRGHHTLCSSITPEIIGLPLAEARPPEGPPTRAYFFRAVVHGAIRARTHAWTRYVVAMDPEVLVLAEQMTYDPTQRVVAVPT